MTSGSTRRTRSAGTTVPPCAHCWNCLRFACAAGRLATFPRGAITGNADLFTLYSERFAERMSKTLGQPVIVDNKAGASTIVGAQQFVATRPDGYNLLYTANVTLSINPHVYKKLPYQVGDLVPVTRTLAIPFVIVVRSDSKLKNLSDLIQEAKRTPGRLNYSSYGIATAPHVAMTVDCRRKLTQLAQ